MSSSNPSAPYFSLVANQWDDLRSGYFTEDVRTKAIQKAYIHPEMVTADIGAGTGFMAEGLAPLVKRVHVVDASSDMLNVASRKLNKFNNLEFHVADGLAIPLPDCSLDVVFANMYLHHCPDPLSALREIVRILRPAGRVIITDMDAHSYEWLKQDMADVWLGFERDQIRFWFDQVDLVNVFVDSTGQTCRSGCSKDGNQAAIGIFVASGTKRVIARDAVKESYSARVKASDCSCSDSNCCSPGVSTLDDIGVVTWDGGYSPNDKAEIPTEAAEFSLGCGNPIAMAGLRPGETVLDIGSGGGIDVFLAARQVGTTGLVYGIDMTPAMLQRARRSAIKGGFRNVKFRFGYAEKLPVESESVDVVISNCVINLTEDKGKVFREAFRVIRKGGRLEVNDMVFGGPILPAVRVSEFGWAECISGALPEQEYIDLVRQAGFLDIHVRRSTSHGTSADVPIYSIQVSAKK